MNERKHNEYTLQIIGTASAPQLVGKTFAMDDETALAAAAEMAKDFEGVRWFMGVRVWKAHDECIGTAVLNKPTTTINRIQKHPH